MYNAYQILLSAIYSPHLGIRQSAQKMISGFVYFSQRFKFPIYKFLLMYYNEVMTETKKQQILVKAAADHHSREEEFYDQASYRRL